MTSRAGNRITGIGVALLSSCRGQFLFLGRADTLAKEERTCSNVKRALKSDWEAYSIPRLADSYESKSFKFDIVVVSVFDYFVSDLADRVLTGSPLSCFVCFSTVWDNVTWWSLTPYAVFTSRGCGVLSFSCRNWGVHLLSEVLQSPTWESLPLLDEGNVESIRLT